MKLTYANVTSTLALFIALGGTSYAVARNSIGTPQLKNGAVSAAKVKRDAITTAKIRDGTIQTRDLSPGALAGGPRGPRGPVGPAVPAGSGAGGALPGSEAWLALDFAAGWTNYGGPWEVAQFRKDPLGIVHLRGLVTRSADLPTPGSTIALLPAGYRPPRGLIFTSLMGNPEAAGRVDVLPSGQVNWTTGPTGGRNYSSLSAISFATD